jgi:hypothetical protein
MWLWLIVLWFVLAVTPIILGFLDRIAFRWALLWLAVLSLPLFLLVFILLVLSGKRPDVDRLNRLYTTRQS